MSWNVILLDSQDQPVKVDRHREGGIYQLDGSTEARLNVTYNYNDCYRAVWDGQGLQETLDGKRASEVVNILEAAIWKLGIQRDDDYWKPTMSNAGYALSILSRWAKQYPDAVFSVV